MSNYNNPNNNTQFYQRNAASSVSVRSFANAPITFVANTTVSFMKRHYLFTMFYAIGLLIVTMVKGITVDAATEIKFEEALSEADKIHDSYVSSALLGEQQAYQEYYRSKGWFSCDQYCTENYQIYMRKQEQLKDAKTLYNEAMTVARKEIGIFSTYAVDDAWRLFWSCWQWGKNFAKRISFYDVIFLAMDSRNESLAVYIGRLVVRVLVNFTIGFLSALVSFVWNLWFFVRSYAAGISGIIFFIGGSVAAFSMIVSVIGAMYAGTAGAAAVVFQMAGPSIEGGRARRRRVHYA